MKAIILSDYIPENKFVVNYINIAKLESLVKKLLTKDTFYFQSMNWMLKRKKKCDG